MFVCYSRTKEFHRGDTTSKRFAAVVGDFPGFSPDNFGIAGPERTWGVAPLNTVQRARSDRTTMTPQTLEIVGTIFCLLASMAGTLVFLSSFDRWCVDNSRRPRPGTRIHRA